MSSVTQKISRSVVPGFFCVLSPPVSPSYIR
nr:MAG TPA: hypothetical protein [Caudoviricetes sp.]DAZ62398.1 MAG TPA: hypothetical protein [Caudoviricetes sp.]